MGVEDLQPAHQQQADRQHVQPVGDPRHRRVALDQHLRGLLPSAIAVHVLHVTVQCGASRGRRRARKSASERYPLAAALWTSDHQTRSSPWAPRNTADEDKIQSEGRKDNAAQHLNAADGQCRRRALSARGEGRFHRRSRSGRRRATHLRRHVESPEPRQGAGDAASADPSVNQGHMGPGGDPAEGKR